MNDPLKENLDPREKGFGKEEIICPKCGYINNDKLQCYHCYKMLSSFHFNYKKGNQTYGSKELRTMEREYNQNYKDYIQPTRWNNISRKFETNPEFVKTYGDPWKERSDFGSETRKQLDALSKVDEHAKTDLIKPT